MKHIATQHISNYYPVEMFECLPVSVVHDETIYDYGRWYVSCGGEGCYSNSMREACEIFGKLVQFAITEGRTAK